MSNSTTISAGGAFAGAMVPFTATWINTAGGSTVTTAATLVGQVLNNGETNWVGYTEGSALYLLQTSESGAEQTTLANGQIFYVSEGSPPSGYLATNGNASPTGSSGDAESSGSASGNNDSASQSNSGEATASTTSSSNDSDSGDASSSSASAASASASTSPNAGNRLTWGASAVAVCGLLAVLSL